MDPRNIFNFDGISTVKIMKKNRAVLTKVKPIDNGFINYLASSFLNFSLILEVGKKFIRDISSQTILGYWWIIIKCILPLILMGLVIHNLGILTDMSIPYPLFLMSGMIIWSGTSQYFMYGVRIFIKLRTLYQNYYIRRLLAVNAVLFIPITITVITILLFSLISIYYVFVSNITINLTILKLLISLIAITLSYLVSIGIICVLSIFSIFTRDIRMSMPMVRQLLFFATPIAYPLSLLDDKITYVLLIINPFATHIEILRWALFNSSLPSPNLIVWNVVLSLTIFFSGTYFIYKSEIPLRDLLQI